MTNFNRLLGTALVALLLVVAPMSTYAKNNGNRDNENEGNKPCQTTAWGHLFAFGFLKHNSKAEVDENCKVPNGIWKKIFGTGGGTDTTAPSATFVFVSNKTNTSATVNVWSNEAAKIQVMYGTTDSYGSDTDMTTSFTRFNSVPLSGLSADTTYHYKFTLTDKAGNMSTSGDRTFKTDATDNGDDTTAPVISAVTISGITNSSAIVSWTTDESATSRVNYGKTTSYGQNVHESALVTSHEETINGLSADTLYHIQVVSRDSSGNQSMSGDFHFTTSATADTTPPAISAVVISGVTASTATVSWTTDESATSRVNYGKTTSYGTTVNNSALVTSHSRILSELDASTTYHVQVQSSDASGNMSVSSDFNFTTSAGADVTAPVISAIGISAITNSGATIYWTTDENTSSKVFYGTSASINKSTASHSDNAALDMTHSASISGLSANTKYYYEIEATDASTNATTSSVFSFTTNI